MRRFDIGIYSCMHYQVRASINSIIDRNCANDRGNDNSALWIVWIRAGANQYFKNNRNNIPDRWSGIGKAIDKILNEWI